MKFQDVPEAVVAVDGETGVDLDWGPIALSVPVRMAVAHYSTKWHQSPSVTLERMTRGGMKILLERMRSDS